MARFDGLAAWPELMPYLLQAASRPTAAAARGLHALYRVVKLQASRRLLPHRKQFFALAAELLPRLQPLRHAHAGTHVATGRTAAMPPPAAAETPPAEGQGLAQASEGCGWVVNLRLAGLR